MALLEVQLLLPADGLDAWTDALIAAGAAAVTVQDDAVDTADEVPVYGEPGGAPVVPGWRRNRVGVLLDEAIAIDPLLQSIARALEAPLPPVLSCQVVDEQDWVRQTQAQFPPLQVGRLWIVPSWHEPPDPHACIVRLDPGVAFGTGTHPTTRLCLQWLEQQLAQGERVLDYGCGSGILSIAAVLLGAGPSWGVDIDPQAVAAALDNARQNAVDAQYTGIDALAAEPERQFDVVVANILANPIMVLAPTLVHRARRGGRLLLSGILDRQVPDVRAAFQAVDPALELQEAGSLDGWVALAGRRAES